MNLFADILQAVDVFSHHTEITQMSMILLVVVIVTGILHFFKQPTIIGYLVAGILLGPVALGVVGTQGAHDATFIELFSNLGIALLLFLVGLDLNLATIKEHGKSALIVGGIQILLSAGLGFIISKFLGFDLYTSGYIALGLAFSSTIIIIKLLTDKHDSESLYGKLAIGVLIVQDLVVMISLMVLSIGGGSGDIGLEKMIVESVMLLAVFAGVAIRILPRVMDWFAKSSEYLLLIGMCRCLLVGGMFLRTGFSFEIGCLLAGMSLSMSPYRREMANKLKSLRDFFLVLFFIHVGLQLSFDSIMTYRRAIVVLSVFVVVVKPLIVYGILRMYKYTHKVSLKTSFTLGQISEFSFLLISMGISVGHIEDSGMLSVVMCIGLISFVLSSYGIVYNDDIFKISKVIFGKSDRVSEKDEGEIQENDPIDVVLFGYGRMGHVISGLLDEKEMKHVIIDHNPKVFRELKDTKKTHVYADATNEEIYHDYLQQGTKMVISTIPDFDDNRLIVKTVKKLSEEIMVIVVAHDVKEALRLYDHGADYVIIPSHISAHHMGYMIEDWQSNLDHLIAHKEEHVEMIRRHV